MISHIYIINSILREENFQSNSKINLYLWNIVSYLFALSRSRHENKEHAGKFASAHAIQMFVIQSCHSHRKGINLYTLESTEPQGEALSINCSTKSNWHLVCKLFCHSVNCSTDLELYYVSSGYDVSRFYPSKRALFYLDARVIILEVSFVFQFSCLFYFS